MFAKAYSTLYSEPNTLYIVKKTFGSLQQGTYRLRLE